MEKALDVERDILKDQEVPNKEFPPSKHFWYQETHGFEGSNLKFNRSTGSSAVPASRYHSRTGNRGGFLHRPQLILPPHLNLIRNPWSPDATETMWSTAFRAGNVSHVAILATWGRSVQFYMDTRVWDIGLKGELWELLYFRDHSSPLGDRSTQPDRQWLNLQCNNLELKRRWMSWPSRKLEHQKCRGGRYYLHHEAYCSSIIWPWCHTLFCFCCICTQLNKKREPFRISTNYINPFRCRIDC